MLTRYTHLDVKTTKKFSNKIEESFFNPIEARELSDEKVD